METFWILCAIVVIFLLITVMGKIRSPKTGDIVIFGLGMILMIAVITVSILRILELV